MFLGLFLLAFLLGLSEARAVQDRGATVVENLKLLSGGELVCLAPYEYVHSGLPDDVTQAMILSFLGDPQCQPVSSSDGLQLSGVFLSAPEPQEAVAEVSAQEGSVQHVLQNYLLLSQSDTSVSTAARDVLSKNSAVFRQIGLLDAVTWVKQVTAGQPRSGGRKILLACIDYTGVHPALAREMEALGLWGGSLQWDAGKKAYVYVPTETSLPGDSHSTQVVTLLVGILADFKDDVVIMPITFDGKLTTCIEGVKAAVAKAKAENKNLIINISLTLGLESYTRTEIDISFRYYYIGKEIERLRRTMSDADIHARWNEIISPFIAKASDLARTIEGMMLAGEVKNYTAWDEPTFGILRQRFSFTDSELNVIRYALQAGKQKYLLFEKSPVDEGFGALCQEALLVSGVGNFRNDYPNFPAAWPGVVGVGASSSTGYLGNSNWGDWVAVYAPGGFDRPIWTQGIKDGWLVGDYAAGTSASAPLVSAVAALVFKLAPRASPSEVKMILEVSSQRVYASDIRRYLRLVDAPKAVRVAFAYDGIGQAVQALEEYFRRSGAVGASSAGEPAALRATYREEMTRTVQAALERVFRAVGGTYNRDSFAALLARVSGEGSTVTQATDELLLALWGSDSEYVRLAAGLFLSKQGRETTVQEAVRAKVAGLTDHEMEAILAYENRDVLWATEIAATFSELRALVAALGQVGAGAMTEDAFLRRVGAVFTGREKLYELYSSYFRDRYRDLAAKRVTLAMATEDIVWKVWEIGETHRDRILVDASLALVDVLKLSGALRRMISAKGPKLTEAEVGALAAGAGGAGWILEVTASYVALKNMCDAIDRFTSPWPADWVSPLAKKTDLASTFTSYVVIAKYIGDHRLSGPIEQFYTEVVSHFCGVFAEQRFLSKTICEPVAANPLNQALWKLICREVTRDVAKEELLKLAAAESRLASIDRALELFRWFHGLPR